MGISGRRCCYVTHYWMVIMSARAGGIRPWIMQRLSAVFMVLALLLFCFTLIFGSISTSNEWQVWFGMPFWNTVVIIFWLALFTHAWIGIRDVIMDYISHDGVRFVMLAIFGFYLIAMTVWMIKIMITAVSA